MKIHKITLFSLALLLGISSGPLQLIHAETIGNNQSSAVTKANTVKEGTWGEANWKLDNNGVLTISDGEIGLESSRPWDNSGQIDGVSVTSVVIGENVSLPVDATKIFANLSRVTNYDLTKLDTSNTENMNNIFSSNAALTSIDLSSFQTENVKTMNAMFNGDTSLTSVDISNWVITVNNSTGTLMSNNIPFVTTIKMYKTQIQKETFTIYGKGWTFINIGNTTIDNPTVLKTVSNVELTAAVKDDFAGKIPGSLGVWIKEPDKVDQNKEYQITYDTVQDGLNYKVTSTIPKDLIPIYAGVNFEMPAPEIDGLGISGTKTLKLTTKASTISLTTIPQIITYVKKYTGDDQITVKTSLGDKVIPVPEAFNYIPDDTFSIDTPQVSGYTASPSQIIIKVLNDKTLKVVDGELDGANYIVYTPVKYEGNGEVSVPNNLGHEIIGQAVSTENLKYGDKVDIQVPNQDGYRKDKTTIQAQVTSDGTLAVVDPNEVGFVTYSATYKGDGTVTIPSNLDDEVVINYPDYENLAVGDVITIEVPDKDGYTKDKITVQAKVIDDNTIEVIDPEIIGLVTYTKKSTGGGGGTVDPEPTDTYENKNQTATVHADSKSIAIYDDSGKLITNRRLASLSDWKTDTVWTTKDGQVYYRVATNEWVKSEDVYLYEAASGVVRTRNNGDYISLKTAHNKTVSNRALETETNWKIDQTVQMNGEKYYRVAYNEFVNTNDVDLI